MNRKQIFRGLIPIFLLPTTFTVLADECSQQIETYLHSVTYVADNGKYVSQDRVDQAQKEFIRVRELQGRLGSCEALKRISPYAGETTARDLEVEEIENLQRVTQKSAEGQKPAKYSYTRFR